MLQVLVIFFQRVLSVRLVSGSSIDCIAVGISSPDVPFRYLCYFPLVANLLILVVLEFWKSFKMYVGAVEYSPNKLCLGGSYLVSKELSL